MRLTTSSSHSISITWTRELSPHAAVPTKHDGDASRGTCTSSVGVRRGTRQDAFWQRQDALNVEPVDRLGVVVIDLREQERVIEPITRLLVRWPSSIPMARRNACYLSAGACQGIHVPRSSAVNFERRMSVDRPSFRPSMNRSR